MSAYQNHRTVRRVLAGYDPNAALLGIAAEFLDVAPASGERVMVTTQHGTSEVSESLAVSYALKQLKALTSSPLTLSSIAPELAESEREYLGKCSGSCGGQCVVCRYGDGSYLAKCACCGGVWTYHTSDGTCVRGIHGYHREEAAVPMRCAA